MSVYTYKAIDPDGILKTGVFEADNIDAANGALSFKGLNILSVKEASKISAVLLKGLSAWRIKRSEIAEFAKNLSIVLKAGIPIITSLEDLSQMIDNQYLKKAVNDIKEQVTTGISFSKALSYHKSVFPDIFIRLVTIGEETGRLEMSISDVADHLQRMEDLSSMIKRALMYPIFALITTGGALVFWIVYVLPRILVVMQEMGIELPIVTRILIVVSNFSRSYWYIILCIPVLLVIALNMAKRKERSRYYVDLMKIKLPIIKQFVYNKLLAVFSEQFRILIVAGITIDRSFTIVANALGSEVFKRALVNAQEQILNGVRISDALRRHRVFPPLVIRMVDIGEESGNLDGQFEFLSKYYFKRLEDVSDKMGKMIEPILIGAVGFVFAVIIVGLLLPIYDVVTKFK
jgi:type II secretory pathway component PulF